jgi:hypothetical protein
MFVWFRIYMCLLDATYSIYINSIVVPHVTRSVVHALSKRSFGWCEVFRLFTRISHAFAVLRPRCCRAAYS